MQEPPVLEERLHQEVAKESVDWRLMFNTCLHVSMFASIHGCMYPCLQVSMVAHWLPVQKELTLSEVSCREELEQEEE